MSIPRAMKILITISVYVALVFVLGLVMATMPRPEPVDRDLGDED